MPKHRRARREEQHNTFNPDAEEPQFHEFPGELLAGFRTFNAVCLPLAVDIFQRLVFCANLSIRYPSGEEIMSLFREFGGALFASLTRFRANHNCILLISSRFVRPLS